MDFLFHHLFLSTLKRSGSKIAVSDSDRALSYQELSVSAGFVQSLLLNDGVRKNDRVLVYLDQEVSQAASILGASAAGAVFVPVSSLLYPEQVRFILHDSGSRFLITSKSRWKSLEAICNNEIKLKGIYFVEDFGEASSLERTSYTIENDLAALLYTSGSTGMPKGVMFSHKNIVAGCQIISEYLELESNDKLLGALQLSFDYGLNQLVTMLAVGGSYRFQKFMLPQDIVRILKEEDITGFAGIPSMWAAMMRSSLDKTDLPKLRYITNSGGAVPSAMLEYLQRALPGVKIYLMYGLTEAFRSTYLPPAEIEKRPGSMGKAIPDTEILVISENGESCGPGEVGELVHRGPTVSMGYWNRPEETEKRFRTISTVGMRGAIPERVVFSGDLVKKDSDGYLYFVGRKDAMLKCSGVRISPTEIEEVAFKSGLVGEAAAVGIADAVAGQVIRLYAVPSNGNNNRKLLEDMIIEFCSTRMPRYMLPREVVILDSLPKTAHGKVDYTTLRERSI